MRNRTFDGLVYLCPFGWDLDRSQTNRTTGFGRVISSTVLALPKHEASGVCATETSRVDDAMTVCDVMRMLEADGWRLVVTRGSHRQFKHPAKPGRVTVAGKPSDEVPPGTLNSIMKQSGLKRQEP
jgi:predicted RNA binding protein YcfA (HicA-like mRNA interferase family)